MSKQIISCGGFFIDNDTIKEVDGELTVNANSVLPAINVTTDVGKVLTVSEEGKWVIAALPEG